MKIFATTQKGIGKAENEDRIVIGKTILSSGIFQTEEDCSIVAIADGVGGNNAGFVASDFIANKIRGFKSVSEELFSDINKDLLNLSNTSKDLNGMATTLSGFCVNADSINLFSIGNTRVYSLQGRKYLKQLTVDDTTLQHLISRGQISSEEAECFDRKNEITCCFGGGDSSLFKIKINQTEKFSVPFLITSDGAHDYLSTDILEDIITEYGISVESCEKIIDSARKNGSQDDISIVLGEL